MAPEEDEPRKISVYDAAETLHRAPSTLHGWVLRYGVRKLDKEGRRILYDYDDFVVIERELFHEHPIPATWQERAEIRERCPLKTAQPFPAAA
jgi:hypothetical protein